MEAVALSRPVTVSRLADSAGVLFTTKVESAAPVRPALGPACYLNSARCQGHFSHSEFWGGDGLPQNFSRRHGKAKSALSRPARRRNSALICRATLGDYALATSAVYGAALVGGGLFAYLRTGSKGSLGGGLTGGALLGATYLLLKSPDSESLGQALGFGSSLLFAAVFGIRLFATKKPLPAGPLLALSAVAAAVFASAYST